MNGSGHLLDRVLLGTVLVACAIFGGGTAAGLPVTGWLETGMILASCIVLWRRAGAGMDRMLAWLLAGAVTLVLFQLVPLPTAWLDALQPILPEGLRALVPVGFRPVTLDVGATLNVLGDAAALALFAAALCHLPGEALRGLLPPFLIAVGANLAVAFVQYGDASGADWLWVGSALGAGFFANANHFATLVFISIPLATALAVTSGRFPVLMGYLPIALIALFATRSAAAAGIGIVITVVSLVVLRTDRAQGRGLLLFAGLITLILGFGVWSRVSQETDLIDTARQTAALTTLQAFWDNPVLGVGFGTFPLAYMRYEPIESVTGYYINHAHNDYLELAFEGGIGAVMLLAAFLLLLARRVPAALDRPISLAATVGLGFVLVHSLVDYPLRTLAVSSAACLLLALIVLPQHRQGEAKRQHSDVNNRTRRSR